MLHVCSFYTYTKCSFLILLTAVSLFDPSLLMFFSQKQMKNNLNKILLIWKSGRVLDNEIPLHFQEMLKGTEWEFYFFILMYLFGVELYAQVPVQGHTSLCTLSQEHKCLCRCIHHCAPWVQITGSRAGACTSAHSAQKWALSPAQSLSYSLLWLRVFHEI